MAACSLLPYPIAITLLSPSSAAFSLRSNYTPTLPSCLSRKKLHLNSATKSSDASNDLVSNEREPIEEGLVDDNCETLPEADNGSAVGANSGGAFAAGELLEPEGLIVIMSCAVGLMTGAGVVLFNLGVHELHDIVWRGIPSTGADWLRKQPLEKHWLQVLSVPASGGVVVGILKFLRSRLVDTNVYTSNMSSQDDQRKGKPKFDINGFLEPLIKALAALVTLGTGNSLGPEGPSVEIGASIANGLGTAFKNSRERKVSLVAAGSAAGISSGFNAAISGCFFAVESVLRPLSADSAPSLTTAMVLLSSVLASVISQAGLGSDPAFKIPAYDFRSPAELPLYLVLGVLCGLVSVCLTKSSNFSSYMFQRFKETTGIPDAFLPTFGGLSVGLIALAYPEVLYWGFENVDILLESRLFQRSPPAMLLLELVGAKIVATSLCRGSGLVGGFYAPSLFIGAALGSAYGKLAGYAITHADPMYHLDALKVAVPQAYALVGMAATLAGVCQVPLTSVLLLFELTRDYRIIIPLMAAVGVSSWVASSLSRNRTQLNEIYQKQDNSTQVNSNNGNQSLVVLRRREINDSLCDVDSSLCMANKDLDEEKLLEEIMVADAMKTHFLAVTASMTVQETLEKMLATKEWCALLVQDDNILDGLITFSDIQQEASTIAQDTNSKGAALTISEICNSWVNKDESFPVVTAYPDMSLKAAWRLMIGRGLRQLPVISRERFLKEDVKVVEGILDRECIQLACRAEATRRLFAGALSDTIIGKDNKFKTESE